MSLTSLAGKLWRALLCASLALALGAATALALGPSRSPLPGFPRFRGVIFTRDSSAATAARQQAIRSALKASSGTNPNCTERTTNPGADLCFWGGPVVHSHRVHLIFWEGTGGTTFPAFYVEKVKKYFADVAQASGASSNVYAVGVQYAGSNGAGEYKVGFNATPEADVYVDSTDPLPAAGSLPTQCTDTSPVVTSGKCVTDEDLRTEVETAETAKVLSGWKSSLEDIYFVFTPAHVGSCFEAGSSAEGHACAFASGGFCAYHSDFGTTGKETLYANLPDGGGVAGCDSFEHPNEASGVDATLDAASHEHNETITDPLGKKPAWIDVIGQEIGDKCLPPETFDIYGKAFAGVPATEVEEKIVPGTLYNQIIGSGHYWLQREWSNTAFNGEGGCVARMLHTEFAPPAEAKATVPATFDGSSSGEVGDPAVYWVWSFGDGMQVATPEPTVAHTYAVAKAYQVTLTAFDAYGNSNTHTTSVVVGAAPPPPPPPPAPEPVTITKTVTVLVPAEPTAYSAAQLAQKLGLPANGATLSGLGTISFGHAECPPACTVALRLYSTKHTTVHHRRVLKRVFIGALTTTVAAKGTGALALTLNATGRKLLRQGHRLPAQLVITVTGEEGGSWQLTRTLTLTSSGKAARHRPR
jgi:PKD domain-containing protein